MFMPSGRLVQCWRHTTLTSNIHVLGLELKYHLIIKSPTVLLSTEMNKIQKLSELMCVCPLLVVRV